MLGDIVEFLNAYRVALQHLTSLLLAAAVWRWGGGPERWLMGVFLATMVLPMYVAWALDLEAVEIGPYAGVIFGIDVIAAALFTAVALYANRNYPLWIAGFQLVALGAHVVQVMVGGVSSLAFVLLVTGPSYGQLFVLLAGFIRHRRRERRFGAYRDWRLSPPGLPWLRI